LNVDAAREIQSRAVIHQLAILKAKERLRIHLSVINGPKNWMRVERTSPATDRLFPTSASCSACNWVGSEVLKVWQPAEARRANPRKPDVKSRR
jgi:hypothetical protein